MILGNTGFQGYITEHRLLIIIGTAHLPNLSLESYSTPKGYTENPLYSAKNNEFFNSLLDMMPRDVFDREEVCYDDDGNRISTRTVRDGSQFRVVKNFPDEQELRSVLDQMARHVEYHEHLPLRRWLLTYTKR